MITNPKTFFEQFQNFIEESGLQLKKFKSNLSNYFTKSEAIDTFLGKTDQAESAKKSDEAIKATQDSEGNVISSTYLKTNTASTTYLTQANASSTYLTKTGKAASASIADTAGSATKATQDAKGNVIDSTYLTKSDATSTYLNKTGKAASATSADTATKATQDSSGNEITTTYLKKVDAESTYLGKTAKAESAKSADSATKAIQDGDGNVISGTYLSKTDASSTYLGKTAKAESAKVADSATTADSATKATNATKASQDAYGNDIPTTYATNTALTQGLAGKANASHTHTKNQITDFPSIPDVSTLIPKSGNRGEIAGYESSTRGTIVSETSKDSQTSSGDISVTKGTQGTTWTKVMYMTSGSVSLGVNWKWSGGKAPTLKFPGVLVCHWNDTGGIASYITGAS